ncbi:SGNH/GDSL hydrolase family protein [Propionibacteriaceae bacterium Y1700]|uniref:SGNH/GDSL hydrolase family protein n=1 Tax=Microlunatus sp. Y1700 TaxID=3418487 RepID=UPI003DA72CEB
MTSPVATAPLRTFTAAVITALCVVIGLPASLTAAAPTDEHRVVTWGASTDLVATKIDAGEKTVRNIVHTSVGGPQAQLSLSNVFGDRPVTFDAVRVGEQSTGAAVVPGTNQPVTFGGQSSVTLQPGEVRQSDPLARAIRADTSLAVSLHVVGDPGALTGHNLAMQTTYVSDAGDATADERGTAFGTEIESWLWVEAVTVRAPQITSTVAFLGDSITDGHSSTPSANLRWPDQFADRIAGTRYGPRYAVMNQGISANKVLIDGAGESALKRFDRDVLDQPGVRTVVVMEGINDIRWDVADEPQDLIDAHRELIRRAHERGICVVASPLVPFEGSSAWTPAREEVRAGFNEWGRTSGEYDAVVDFDAVVRDPARPTWFRPGYGAADNLHPTDAGYAAMAAAVDPQQLACDR